ncbi:zinc-dependent alcohol dehydrogenase family protein [Nocardioides sp. cx-173]|uniref:zinc-dependent alcohol dehydrogenase family protein n=1 Tax=Nocardioides sp. cx-173 TaxID=2898796 RepID=UPI001E3BB272|nr:zinc-dependent alcohol dehydrogenase family protein [Nocardioides sp. cx-173]MCD4525728.1 zinc-dependent alcohol dehydrogenase family protein [Nocardioides sp. cx-173]UGB43976.1 zinc-dependent alcohol dehydrogenase family protein [Nocardioides sp. cx-173]
MRATTIHGPGDIRVSQVPDPVLTSPTDAIVKVTAGCICGSDLWPYRGENDITPGATIGHECIGVVEEVGSEVASFRPGDFVIVPFCHCDNTCAHCEAGVQSACSNLSMTTSGQAEYALVGQAEGSLVKLDGEPDPALVPSLLALSDVMPTGWHAAVAAGVPEGGTVVVVGDGAVGLCGVLAASIMGAEKVIAMSRHESRQQIATAFGATHLVAARGKEGAAEVKEITGGIGAHAVLECVGTDDAMGTAFAVARPGATVGFVGVPHGVQLPVRRMFQKNFGLRGGMAPVRRYLPEMLDHVLAGRMEPGLVFDLTLPLAQAADGYRAMDERRAVKVLLEP